MKSREAGTAPDDIPPVHVLEAAQNQDRKETEDLLAGFDRPSRGPKRPSAERDFVDYYAKKKNPGIDSGPVRLTSSAPPSAAAKGPRQVDVSTVVVPRKSEGMPAWLAWAGAATAMLIVGGAVAYLATSDAQPSKADATTGPSAATTITAATPPSRASVDQNIPPPSPVDANATTTTTAVVVESAAPVPVPVAPRASGKRGPGPNVTTNASTGGAIVAPPSAATTTEATKPAPRDDLIRDM